MQEQDRRADQYMELLEKYHNHENREEMIAKEMGWEDADDDDDEEEIRLLADLETGNMEALDALDEEEEDYGFEEDPLYQCSKDLVMMVFDLQKTRQDLDDSDAMDALVSGCMIVSSKLAVVISNQEDAEVGMQIAYLKRGLKAVTDALNGFNQLVEQKLLGPETSEELRNKLFEVRDVVVSLMGQAREEWRRLQE